MLLCKRRGQWVGWGVGGGDNRVRMTEWITHEGLVEGREDQCHSYEYMKGKSECVKERGSLTRVSSKGERIKAALLQNHDRSRFLALPRSIPRIMPVGKPARREKEIGK